MTKPCKGGARTGWPQHVWALELKNWSGFYPTNYLLFPQFLENFEHNSCIFDFYLMIVKLPDYYLVEIITQSVSWTKK